MLELKNIVKTYITGELKQDALKGVSIKFRENEFVSILGQSGSGKTTMLNIIGGLDRYTSGDLIINGVSTKKYKDSDWDYYRNDSIGFVFQSYNLIPHQTVLANVELALTLAGVSKKERKERAKVVLEKVGLKDHMHKKPNQMSGGQMQRVAIARALINNPDILLADEPTGALDSETSVQIMELLKEIAKDKLVIMVTHNPELAEQYSTRIVKLKDGQITDDSNPCDDVEEAKERQKKKKVSMSFGTALALSFNNLKTKKGRTILTSFAGSIGIIGIALILALSTGMSKYINDIQKSTMTSYPLSITERTFDIATLMGEQETMEQKMQDALATVAHDEVHVDYTVIEAGSSMMSGIAENNLTGFKRYLDDPNSEIWQYIGENGVKYSYDTSFMVYTKDPEDELLDTDTQVDHGASSAFSLMGNSMSLLSSGTHPLFSMMDDSTGGNFSEVKDGQDGETVSPITKESYELLYGEWPTEYTDILLVLDRKNALTISTLYSLGFVTEEVYDAAVDAIFAEEEPEEITFSYEEMCEKPFYLIAACDLYEKNSDGTFTALEEMTEDFLKKNGIKLNVCGIIKPLEGADNANITTTFVYTTMLTNYMVEHTMESDIVTAQMKDPETNVLNGTKFIPGTDKEKAEELKNYMLSMDEEELTSLVQMMTMVGAAMGMDAMGGGEVEMPSMEDMELSEIAAMMGMSETDLQMALAYGQITEEQIMTSIKEAMEAQMASLTMNDKMEMWFDSEPDMDTLMMMYDNLIGEASYEDNMKAFGYVTYDTPSSISIYTDSFEDKDFISECIDRYNETAAEEDQIVYTDYIGLLTSSLTTIINGISYVLIAFVAISLIVSSIMIGIITHISVLERTKEIGILRALGASKGNIAQVFNAETFIVGCFAGILGIVVSCLLLIPMNMVIQKVSGLADLKAILPWVSAIILIGISIIITVIGGLLPARKAAKKDPVIALRSE
ncbi:MAG: ABC transporter ATP-binding protein/permease [Lachnospiraceae bacterium]|nr:ABC transporter ATP-binding protein/permease [Lachnospiraceae bacterium]